MLHGQTRYNPKSRFLEELPEASLKWLTPKKPSFNAAPSWSGSFNASQSSSLVGGSTYNPSPVARKDPPAHGLKVGQKVFHNKFGEGAVLALEGTGDDARAHINFPRHGAKWLALSVAKLTPV
jgi:DNA helicase-2/ATP-dependent DNA helicase PcrA